MARFLTWFLDGLSILAGLAAFLSLSVALEQAQVPWNAFGYFGVAIGSAVLAFCLNLRKKSKLVARRLPNIHAFPPMMR